MYGTWLSRLLSKRGLVTETTPPPTSSDDDLASVRVHLRGSLQLRHVDAGSCNGCELEIASIFSPFYDAEQYGIRLVASPRHADAALVTGPVTKNMAGPLATTLDALASPSVVIAIGDCAKDCGVFKGAYAVEGSVTDVAPVQLVIPGCPPSPQDIIAALRRLSGS
jgi:Ni,Fe-hydrogenase III small subunit